MKNESTWDLNVFYETKDIWEDDYNKILNISKTDWEKLKFYKGKAGNSAVDLRKLLDSYFDYSIDLERLYTFAHLRHDEDVSDDLFKDAFKRSIALMHQFNKVSSWVEPEILQIDKAKIDEYLKCKELSQYKFFLKKLFDKKEHVLSSDKEEIVALVNKSQMTPSSAFSAFSDADLQFSNVSDAGGCEHILTKGTYQVLMKSDDRVLRKNTFKTLHRSFGNFENTLCELINGQIQNHIFNKTIRGYNSSLEASLKPHNIPVKVYRSLIEAVRDNLSILHKYVELRKNILKIDQVYPWDMTNSLVNEYDKKFTYEEACEIVVSSVDILGKDYQKTLKDGITRDKWVDIYERKGKRSGAYSSGCYDSMPYILMNFHGTLNDVLTLAHEAGHSMNSLMSNKAQPYVDAQYPIFIAEVASTFNEQLTYEYLIKKASSHEEKMFIINQQVDGIRATFFRQVMFAEFELKIHELAEQDIPLTPTLLKEEYRKLNVDYFGPNFVVDEELAIEFMRVPHFFYNFYVYQYATGIAAALSLVEIVKKNGPDKYLKFLSAGGSDYPIPLLQKVGVDMCKGEAVDALIFTFSKLINELTENYL